MKKITVDEAMKRGKWMCLFWPLIFFASPMLVGIYLMKFYENSFIFPLAGFISGIVFSFLIWGFTSVQWKIWAFTHVCNVHELQRRAVNEKLIWNNGNFFNRFEIKSAKQRAILKDLESRFNEPEELNDNVSVAESSYFYISKKYMYLKLAIGIAAIGYGIYLYFNAVAPKEKFLVYAAPVLGALMIFQAYKGLTNTKPMLILDDEGIRLQKTGLIRWEDIFDISVMVKDKEDVLSFYHNDNHIELELENIAIKTSELRILIETYRARHQKKKVNVYQH